MFCEQIGAMHEAKEEGEKKPLQVNRCYGTAGCDDEAEPYPSCPSRRVTEEQKKWLIGTFWRSGTGLSLYIIAVLGLDLG